eukprot:1012159-Pelagomonas_calceolata.AAC.1
MYSSNAKQVVHNRSTVAASPSPNSTIPHPAASINVQQQCKQAVHTCRTVAASSSPDSTSKVPSRLSGKQLSRENRELPKSSPKVTCMHAAAMGCCLLL